MVTIGSTAQRKLQDFNLSRYACYLIVQNGDPEKPAIAAGQTYFAVQTRRQEISDNLVINENEQRLFLRNELKKHNKQLNSTAHRAGVETTLDFAIFQNHGYKGLYGGLDKNGIHKRKGLKKSQKILDFMGSTELAANLFRATQAEEKLRRENVIGKQQANQTHFHIGNKVRQTIKDIGGIMPENLPTPERSINQLEYASEKISDKTKKESKAQQISKKHEKEELVCAKFSKGNIVNHVKLRNGKSKNKFWLVIRWFSDNGSYKQIPSMSFKTYRGAMAGYNLNCWYLLALGHNPTPCD